MAHEIIGPGAGDKTKVTTKEEADHSLPYLVAVALLDGEVTPQQYSERRLADPDVQALLRRVEVVADPDLSARFPEQQGCRLVVRCGDGSVLRLARDDYRGPESWAELEAKYLSLGGPPELIPLVKDLDKIEVAELTASLSRASGTDSGSRSAGSASP